MVADLWNKLGWIWWGFSRLGSSCKKRIEKNLDAKNYHTNSFWIGGLDHYINNPTTFLSELFHEFL